MKKRTKVILGTATTVAITLTMCVSVIPANAENESMFGNMALRPASSITYTGTSTDGENFDSSALVLDSVAIYNTDVTAPNDNNGMLFITNNIGYILWPAATVSCVDGQPDMSSVVAYEYAVNDEGAPVQIISSTGKITSISYDEVGRLVSYSNGMVTETFTYDADGNVQEVYANTTVTYDENGRIIGSVHYDTGVFVYYYYDTLGYLRETVTFTTGEGLETMTVYDYGEVVSQLGDFTMQYPDVTAATEAVTAASSSNTVSTTTTTDSSAVASTTDTTTTDSSTTASSGLGYVQNADGTYTATGEDGHQANWTDEQYQEWKAAADAQAEEVGQQYQQFKAGKIDENGNPIN